jgi:RimJ/RimL family protein N-acetyltransferase
MTIPPPLLLRPWRASDVPALRAAIDESLDALRPWMSWAPEEPTTLDVLAARLSRYAQDFAEGSRWRFAVLHADTGLLLGGASLHPYTGPGALEVGYWVRSSWLRRKVASAAAAALARHAFDAHAVERAEIWCDTENHASARVARGLGFIYAGPLLIVKADGTPRTLAVFRLDTLSALRTPTGAEARIETQSAE